MKNLCVGVLVCLALLVNTSAIVGLSGQKVATSFLADKGVLADKGDDGGP